MVAYKAVFSANATQEDVELVLSDLANASRYYQVPSEKAILRKDVDLRYRQGMRYVFARILRFTEMPDHQIAALEQAARLENQVDVEDRTEI